MAWSKLGYVKATPLTALPKVASGSPGIKIWESPNDPGQYQFSDSKIIYNGITFGDSARVPVGPGGEEATFNMVLSCTGVDKDNYYLGCRVPGICIKASIDKLLSMLPR